ncbi:hypothetical protein RSAG8_03214, partial [Rhizoctonia solani AG-8 WAC10335]
MLKRLALNLNGRNKGSKHPNAHSLNTDKLEDALAPITDLRLGGAYFNWESKAYHGLVSLRLDHTDSYSISEIQLASILESSPRLRWIDMISMPLSMIVFSCANLVNFYSDRFLQNTSDVCRLLSLAPGLRGLAMSHAELLDSLPDMAFTLNTLYLLNDCEIERSLLEDMIGRWTIKQVVMLGSNYISHEGKSLPLYQLREEYSGQELVSGLREELSSLLSGDVQLEFASWSYDPNWSLPMSLFLGPHID